MRSVRMHRTGEPDVLLLDEVPDPPAPVRDELLVRTSASSVNGTDLGLRRGGMRIATAGRMPFTLGFDLSGTVERCGPDVTAFAPVETVMALLDGGVAVSTRPVSRDALLARVRPRWLPGSRRFASVMTAARSADLARLARLVDEGRLRVHVDSVHGLDQVHVAHRRAQSSPSGKVIIRVTGDTSN